MRLRIGSRVSRAIWVACFVLIGLVAGTATAQEVKAFRETAVLPTDQSVMRKLQTARDYFDNQDWEEGFDFLHKIEEEHRSDLVKLSTGRYENTRRYIRRVLAALPPEGQNVWRERHDAEAKRLLEEAKRWNSSEPLERIREEFFLSTSTPEALLRLGDLLFERGEITSAVETWSTLLPPDPLLPNGDGEPIARWGPIHLRQTSIEHPLIKARLLLADLATQRIPQATSRMESLKTSDAEFRTTFAGKEGVLVETLEELLSDAESWKATELRSDWPTFAGSNRRNGISTAPLDIGAPSWSWPLTPNPLPGVRPAAAMNIERPRTFPVIVDGVLYHNDRQQILGHQIESGLPILSRPEKPVELTEDALRVAPLLPHRWAFPFEPTVGHHWNTLTAHQGWLYGLTGSPIAGRSPRELRASGNRLHRVAIADPEQIAEGEWPIDSRSIGDGDWSFLGTPIVEGERLFVVAGRGQPNVERQVICFDVSTGTPLWFRPVFGAVSPVEERYNIVRSDVLSLAEDLLIYVTHYGAVVCLESDTGVIRWATLYRSQSPSSTEEAGDPRRIGLLPALISGRHVIVKPNDSDALIAIDLFTGLPLWSVTVPDRIRHLIGVQDGTLIASGRSIWGIEVDSGRVMWGGPREHSEHFGFGRGLLVGSEVWFPTHHQIERRDIRSGIPTGHPIRLDAKGGIGGNLLIHGDRLVIAEPQRLVVYDPFARRIRTRSVPNSDRDDDGISDSDLRSSSDRNLD